MASTADLIRSGVEWLYMSVVVIFEWPQSLAIVSRNPIDGGRPDAARWKAMAAWAFPLRNLRGVEHLDEGGPIEYQITVMEEIAAAYHDTFGAWPQNRGKWVYVPPVVDPPPPNDPPPAKDCSCGNWLKRDGGRKPDIWRWIKCFFGGKKRCK